MLVGRDSVEPISNRDDVNDWLDGVSPYHTRAERSFSISPLKKFRIPMMAREVKSGAEGAFVSASRPEVAIYLHRPAAFARSELNSLRER